QSVDEGGELRSREPHHAVADRRPAKGALFKSLPEQHQPGPVPGQDLQPIRPLRPENEDRARERIVPQLLAYQRCKTVGTAPEAPRPRPQNHPHPGRNSDHAAPPAAPTPPDKVAGSTPGSTRTVAPPTTISIGDNPP